MITDELRAWARDNTVQGEVLTTLPAQHPIRGTLESLVSIADRIDEMNESMVGCTADEWDYWESTHVELPKDADGEYIHIGDVMEIEGRIRFEVRFLTLTESEWTANSEGWFTEKLRHHHAPTVEDVLEELLREYDRDDSELTNGEIIERFAARLRLAGDAE